MLLVREAPGVSLISSRLTRVVGVMDSSCAGPESAETVIDSVWEPSFSSKCKMGAVPESTAMVCPSLAKEAAEAVTRYSPSGTAAKAGRAANKRTTNRKVRFMESYSPEEDRRAAFKPQLELISEW